MAGGGGQGRRPAGCSRGPVLRRCDPAAAAWRPAVGVCRVGVSARAAGEHQEQQRSVGGDEVWQLAAAGSPGGVAGGWVQGRRPAGAAVGRLPGGVIRQRQQAASRCPGLGVCRVGVSARMAGHHQEQRRSGWCREPRSRVWSGGMAGGGGQGRRPAGCSRGERCPSGMARSAG